MKRVNTTARSASFSRCMPGIVWNASGSLGGASSVGSTMPSFWPNSTVVAKPCRVANSLAIMGIDCSARYSCSAAMKTTRLPAPTPSLLPA